MFTACLYGAALRYNSEAREWRHDSEKQNGIENDYPKTLSRKAGLPKTRVLLHVSPLYTVLYIGETGRRLRERFILKHQ